MTPSNARSLIAVLVFLAALPSAARAGTVEYDLAKFNPEEWEVSHPDCVKVEADGLHVRVPKDAPRVTLRLKRWVSDELDMTLRFERVKFPPTSNLRVGFFLDNPDVKAHDEISSHIEWYTDGEGWFGEKGKPVPGCRIECSVRKDGKDVVPPGGGFDHGETRGLRFVKTDTHVYPMMFQERSYANLTGQWQHSLWHTFRPEAEDVDRFQPGFYVEHGYYGSKEEIEVVFRTLTVWGALIETPGEPPPDPKVKHFDFGPPAQQLAEDFTPVTHRVKYTPERGWGWVDPREPIDRNYYLPAMTNEEAVKVGMPPSPNTHYWRGGFDMVVNYMKYHKKSYMAAWGHGGDYVEYFKTYMDLKTPVERDHVGVGRPYGFPYDQPIEADQWELRGATYVDDDLSTTFAVDLPNDRYSLLIGVGYNLNAPPGRSPFSVDAEGLNVQKLGGNWARCNCYRVDDVEVKDGRLDLRFYANRRLAMNLVDAWNVGVSWHVNYLIVIPSDRRDDIDAEEWRIIRDRGLKVRQVTFAPGRPALMTLRDGHVVVNGKPFVPMLWQAHHAPDTQRHYPYYLWGNTDAIANATASFTGSQHFMRTQWFKLSAADNYPWRTIDHLNLNHLDGKLALIRVDGLLTFMPREVAGEGGTLQDARGRTDRWNVKPPLNSRLGREIQREAYSMVNYQLRLHPTL
ncbi:MAG TPA: hypothetical protein VMX57_03975, partial [Planctomycetota bacterium]|nr:hypothetical protein [Planctomycetota bacterium]